MTRAFVLHSGGVDSTAALALAIASWRRGNVTSVSIDYGQLHRIELDAACRVAEAMGVSHRQLTLSKQPDSPLTSAGLNKQIPDKKYDELGEGVSPSYHHFRNGQLLSLITAYAVAQLGQMEHGEVWAGMHAEDAHNWAYPDCTPEFLGAMANAIHVGTYFRVRLITPFQWSLKFEVIQRAMRTLLDVPWELTYSCYRGGSKHCGACPTCHARMEAFRMAGLMDPTEYAP